MTAKTNDLWVLIEVQEDGSPKKVGLELLNPGRRLADKQKGALVGIILGKNTKEAVREAGNYGADQVIVIEDEAFWPYSTDAYTAGNVESWPHGFSGLPDLVTVADPAGIHSSAGSAHRAP